MNDWIVRSAQLRRDGYCVVPQVLDRRRVDLLGAFAERYIAERPDDDKISAPMPLGPYQPEIAELIVRPNVIEALNHLGLEDLRYYSAVLLSAKPGDGIGGWHQDWFGWDYKETSEKSRPPEIALLYYLVDTHRDNGCLRVLPGSQRADFEWRSLPLSAFALAEPQEAVDVAVRAGDVVVLDARVFHGRHANRSSQRRTVLSLWYVPGFNDLDEPLRAYIAGAVNQDWKPLLQGLVPEYTGQVPVAKANYGHPNAY